MCALWGGVVRIFFDGFYILYDIVFTIKGYGYLISGLLVTFSHVIDVYYMKQDTCLY